MIPPETRYTHVGDARIGYQIVGDGPVDLVFLTGIASNIETMWDLPPYARMIERMASYSRLILFDARGSGVSDPLEYETFPSWEHWTDDLQAVLAAAESERCALLAQFDGSIPALLFAATQPDRTAALILWHGYAAGPSGDSRYRMSDEEYQEQLNVLEQLWGSPDLYTLVDPSFSEEQRRQAAKWLRTVASPRRMLAVREQARNLDPSDALSSIVVPTLLLHRGDNNVIPLDWTRYVADRISGARLIVLPGADIDIWAEGSEEIQDHIEEFLTGARRPVKIDRVLATVLFTDIVGSTHLATSLGDRRWKELLGRHDKTARAEIERFHGKLVNTMGDGLLATFDGPGRAIRCAHALGRALEPAGIKIRAGLHTGEIELREGDDIGGIAVHIASRVMGEAGPGEVVCSRTVKDLVAGSEFTFDDRGMCALKGVPDEWQLYAVRQA